MRVSVRTFGHIAVALLVVIGLGSAWNALSTTRDPTVGYASYAIARTSISLVIAPSGPDGGPVAGAVPRVVGVTFDPSTQLERAQQNLNIAGTSLSIGSTSCDACAASRAGAGLDSYFPPSALSIAGCTSSIQPASSTLAPGTVDLVWRVLPTGSAVDVYLSRAGSSFFRIGSFTSGPDGTASTWISAQAGDAFYAQDSCGARGGTITISGGAAPPPPPPPTPTPTPTPVANPCPAGTTWNGVTCQCPSGTHWDTTLLTCVVIPPPTQYVNVGLAYRVQVNGPNLASPIQVAIVATPANSQYGTLRASGTLPVSGGSLCSGASCNPADQPGQRLQWAAIPSSQVAGLTFLLSATATSTDLQGHTITGQAQTTVTLNSDGTAVTITGLNIAGTGTLQDGSSGAFSTTYWPHAGGSV